MLNDNYSIKSTIQRPKRSVNQNIRTFLEFFNNFYNRYRLREFPSFFYEMKDPYGLALLCEDYKSESIKYDMDLTCKQIFNGEATEEHMDMITYHGQFTFKEILEFLYMGFWFDYSKAMAVYRNQGDAFHIFNQIINGNGYIYNRAHPEYTHSRHQTKYATESIIELDENAPIQLPHIWRLCDGMSAPFIVMKHNRDIRIVNAECHGYGEGIFVLGGDKIIDVLKINDTWFTDLPLENRLKFGYKCKEYDIAQYGKAWSWRSILDVGKMLDANSVHGLLVRGSRDDFFNTRWFNWSKTSLVYCYENNHQLKASMRGRATPDFYTLEGDLGVIHPIEEKRIERVYLDDFDIREFQKIMELDKNGN